MDDSYALDRTQLIHTVHSDPSRTKADQGANAFPQINHLGPPKALTININLQNAVQWVDIFPEVLYKFYTTLQYISRNSELDLKQYQYWQLADGDMTLTIAAKLSSIKPSSFLDGWLSMEIQPILAN